MVFQILGLTALGIFYGCYIGKMLLQRRRGIRTDQMGKGKTGSAQRLEQVMKCATYLTVAWEILSIARNTTALPTALRYVGAVPAFLGTVFFAAAVITMRDSWRAGVSASEKTELVTGGIFQISRNPAFLGFDLMYLGILLMFFNPLLCALSLLSALMLHLQIVCNEEPFLRQVFGKDYLRYEKQVCRYLGRHHQ